jgi:hypothetical protein
MKIPVPRISSERKRWLEAKPHVLGDLSSTFKVSTSHLVTFNILERNLISVRLRAVCNFLDSVGVIISHTGITGTLFHSMVTKLQLLTLQKMVTKLQCLTLQKIVFMYFYRAIWFSCRIFRNLLVIPHEFL